MGSGTGDFTRQSTFSASRVGWYGFALTLVWFTCMSAHVPANPTERTPRTDESVPSGPQAILGQLRDAQAAADQGIDGGLTPLHLAVLIDHVEAVNALCEAGAEMEAQTFGGWSPLHLAVFTQAQGPLRAMIAHGADVNTRNSAGRSPLCTAISKGELALAELLISAGAELSATDRGGLTPLQIAAIAGETDAIHLLIEHGALLDQQSGPDRRSALGLLLRHAAPEHDRAAALLVNRGAALNEAVTGTADPLHAAAAGGMAATVTAFVNIGRSVDAGNGQGRTPLEVAVGHDRTSVAAVLIRHGADRWVRDCAGRTLLHHAVLCGDSDMVKLLLDVDASMGPHTDKAGRTALHLAAGNGDDSLTRLLLDVDVPVDQASALGMTPLMMAARQPRESIVALLLSAGAPVNAADRTGYTALHHAVETDRPETAHALLEAGADVNATNALDQSALQIAAMRGYLDVLEVLLASPDVNPKAPAQHGRTARQWANLAGQQQAAAMLGDGDHGQR